MEQKVKMGTTPLVVFILLLGTALYDLFLVVSRGTDASISAFMVSTVNKSPLIYGVLCLTLGHFIYGMKLLKMKCGDCGSVNLVEDVETKPAK